MRAPRASPTGHPALRHRDPTNRRVHLVELTDAGNQLFHRLRVAAVAHDKRLLAGLSNDGVVCLAGLLEQIRRNVTGPIANAVVAATPDRKSSVMRQPNLRSISSPKLGSSSDLQPHQLTASLTLAVWPRVSSPQSLAPAD